MAPSCTDLAGGNLVDMNVLTPESTLVPAVEPGRSSRSQVERRAAVRVTGKFKASAARVFDAWITPRIAGKWLFATASRPLARVAIDARAGGGFRLVERSGREHIEYTGVYIEIARPSRLAFTLSAENHQQAITRVIAEILPLPGRRHRCEVSVVHEGVPREYVGRVESRWTGMLYGLGQILSS